ncbi:MAG: tetratricopeptide repeat protein [Deltaproteobacteria bacterium]|nr:tetratricopeptide repeat protein [Deltaproteobacteria bacterium]
MNRGRAHQRAGELDQAIAAFDEAIEMAPFYPTAYLDRGATRELQHQSKKAIADLSRAIALAEPGEERGTAYFNRALAQESIGAIDRAFRDHRAALADGRAEAEAELARLADAHGGTTVDRPSVKDEARANLLCDEARAILNRDPVEALRLYHEALELLPGSQEALHGIGIIYAMLGRTTAAMAAFDRSLAIQPQYLGIRAESLFNRGMLYAGAGRHAEALADLEACHALCLDPDAEFPVLGDAAKEQQLVASIEQRIARLRAHLARPR